MTDFAPPWWRNCSGVDHGGIDHCSDEMSTRSWLTLCGGILSLVSCAAVLFVYYRRRHTSLFNGANHFVALSLVVSLLSSVNFITAATMRLFKFEYFFLYCDVSGMFVQLFTIPAQLAIVGFFLALFRQLRAVVDQHSELAFFYNGAAVVLVFGVVSSGILSVTMPINPEWQTQFSPVGAPWCWIPPDWDTNVTVPITVPTHCNKDGLIMTSPAPPFSKWEGLLAQWLAGYVVLTSVPIIGLVVMGRLTWLHMGCGSASTFVQHNKCKRLMSAVIRFFYVIPPIATWTIAAINRAVSQDSPLQPYAGRGQSLMEPLLPFLMSIVFLFMEIYPLVDLCCARESKPKRVTSLTRSAKKPPLEESNGPSAVAPAEDKPSINNNSPGTDGMAAPLYAGAGDDDDTDNDDEDRDEVASRGRSSTVLNAVGSGSLTYALHETRRTQRLRLEREARLQEARDEQFRQLQAQQGISMRLDYETQTVVIEWDEESGGGQVGGADDWVDGGGANVSAEDAQVEVDAIQKRADTMAARATRMVNFVNQAREYIPRIVAPVTPTAWHLAVYLSFLAGYCDCCGFLTLGLFTAHITGNFATLGSALIALQNQGGIADVMLKVEGLIVFGVMAWVTSLVIDHFAAAHRWLLVFEALFMVLSYVFATMSMGKSIAEGRETIGRHYLGHLTGLTMVAGMAIQNGFQRKYLVGLPITTLMTGNTVGFIWDLRTLINKRGKDVPARNRLRNAGMAIAAFVSGCAVVTGIIYAEHNKRCKGELTQPVAFVFAPLFALIAVVVGWNVTGPDSGSPAAKK